MKNHDLIQINDFQIPNNQVLVYDTLSLTGIPTMAFAKNVLGYLINPYLKKISDWKHGYITILGISNNDTTNSVYAQLQDLKKRGIIDWYEYPREINGKYIFIREYRIPRLLYLESLTNRKRRFLSAQPSISKKLLLVRDNYQCVYCGTPLTTHTLTIDHIIPRSKGGKTTWDNILASCKRCNSLKGDMSLNEFLQKQKINKNIRAFVPPITLNHKKNTAH